MRFFLYSDQMLRKRARQRTGRCGAFSAAEHRDRVVTGDSQESCGSVWVWNHNKTLPDDMAHPTCQRSTLLILNLVHRLAIARDILAGSSPVTGSSQSLQDPVKPIVHESRVPIQSQLMKPSRTRWICLSYLSLSLDPPQNCAQSALQSHSLSRLSSSLPSFPPRKVSLRSFSIPEQKQHRTSASLHFTLSLPFSILGRTHSTRVLKHLASLLLRSC